MRILETSIIAAVCAASQVAVTLWTEKQPMSFTTTISIGADKKPAQPALNAGPTKTGYIGMCIAKHAVTEIFAGSPAEKAGVVVGDKILDINDQTTYGLSDSGMADKITGPLGTTFDIIFERAGEQIKRTFVRSEAVPAEVARLRFATNNITVGNDAAPEAAATSPAH